MNANDHRHASGPVVSAGGRVGEMAARLSTPTVVDAYNETPLALCLDYLDAILKPGAAVLDMGCGEGALTHALATNGIKAYGVDVDPARLGRARVRTPAANSVYVSGSAESLPFASETFDGLVSVSVLQYVNWRKVLRECERVLKPGGRAIFLENLRGHPLARLYRVVRRHAWAYPRYLRPAAHIDWSEVGEFGTVFGEADLGSHHLLTPFMLLPHALRERRRLRFSLPARWSFDALKRLDRSLLGRWKGLSGSCWLFTARCSKTRTGDTRRGSS